MLSSRPSETIGAVSRMAGLGAFSSLIPAIFTVFVTVLIAAAALVLQSGTAQARYASIVVDGNTGKVLHASRPDTRLYPASLTKIMTLYMLFEALNRGRVKMNTRIAISRRAAGQPPSRLGLRRGQTISVRDAAMALITKSANDVATAVAEHLGGSEIKFAIQMTKRAHRLGMKKTQFRNASGLPNRRQRSTARDMATLARAIQRDFPKYYSLFKTKTHRYKGRTLRNHNRLLGQYEGTDGIKTGYIRASGFNLVASVRRNGRHLIGVVFGGKSGKRRDKHMIKLLDRGFKKARVMVASHNAPPLPGARPQSTADVVKALMRAAASDRSAAIARMAPDPATNEFLAASLPAQALRLDDQLIAAVLATSAKAAANALAKAPSKATSRTISKHIPTARARDKSAAAPRASLRKRRTAGNWGIQVGAYSKARPAELNIKAAIKHLPKLLRDTRQYVEKLKRPHGTVFRARLVGMTEAHAHKACSRLNARHMACVPVPAPAGVELAAARG